MHESKGIKKEELSDQEESESVSSPESSQTYTSCKSSDSDPEFDYDLKSSILSPLWNSKYKSQMRVITEEDQWKVYKPKAH